ncbi:MAG: response regulator [Magnetospirillum sp.]|nr:response regulator [Magnetospirillum sp.]
MRLLVVEDSAINRMVVSKMLDRLGIVYDLADDGAQALAMFRSRHYGMVLTDFHMPGMDGVTLTRIIRAGRAGAGVPIVALTADVMPETAALCASVGMQGYLTKPVSLDVLDDAIAQHLPRALELRQPVDEVSTAAPERPAPQPASQILDTAVLGEIFGGLDDEAMALLNDFRATTESRLSGLQATLADGDAEQGRGHAHTARGTARSVGANALAEVFGAIDDALSEQDMALARHLAERAVKQLEVFRELLSELQARPRPTGGTE